MRKGSVGHAMWATLPLSPAPFSPGNAPRLVQANVSISIDHRPFRRETKLLAVTGWRAVIIDSMFYMNS